MRKSDKLLITKAFLRSWRREFDEALSAVVQNQFRQILDENDQNAVGDQQLKYFERQKANLENFNRSLSLACERYGISDNLSTEVRIPLDTAEEIRSLQSRLAQKVKIMGKRIQEIKRVRPRRKRIPAEIAFELARAIHFCAKSPESLKEVLNQIEQSNSLQAQVKKTVLSQKLKFTLKIISKLDTLRAELKKVRSESKKTHIKEEIKKLIQKRQQIALANISWAILGSIRSGDTRWALHLKEHLLRSLLSEGKKKLIKSFSGDAQIRRQKARLIRKMEDRNQITCLTTP